MLDALAVRGWRVDLRTGDAAREALKRFRDPHAGLRVLCLPEPLEPAAHNALERALDPLGRGDLLVVDFSTPRAVVEAILRASGYRVGARRAVRPVRSTRSYLAHATLMEHQVDVGYWSRYGMGAAAAGIAILGGMSAFWAMKPPRVHTPAVASSDVAATPKRSRLVEDSTFSAVSTAPMDIAPPPRVRPISADEHVPEEEPATLEPIELEPVPLEDEALAIPPSSSTGLPDALARGGAPDLLRPPRSHTIDPFGDVQP
ncbi:MAG: hypothetical protein AAGA54_37165 [Myxococcota bacterium]